MKTKVVVTGGAGFIGSHICDESIKRGFETHTIDNLSGGKRQNVHPEAHFHEIDICDYEKISPVLSDATYVFHLAALPRVQYSIENPQETNDVNIGGTLNVFRAAKERGVRRVIYSASSSAYGDQAIMPLREDMSVNPLSPYGLQKYVGEHYARVFSLIYGLETVSLRYFNVYGSRFDPSGAYALVIGNFLEKKKKGELMTITGDGEQTRDFTHVSDVVSANFLAATSEKVGKGEVINIGAGRNVSINTIARIIGGNISYISPRIEPRHTLADNSRARALLNWKPQVEIEEGIKDLLEQT